MFGTLLEKALGAHATKRPELVERALRDSPLVKQLTADIAATEEADRAAKLQQLADLCRERDKALPPLAKKRDAAKAAVEKHNEAGRELGMTYMNAMHILDGQSASFEQQINKVRWALREQMPQMAKDFIAELSQRMERFRKLAKEQSLDLDAERQRHADYVALQREAEDLCLVPTADLIDHIEILREQADEILGRAFPAPRARQSAYTYGG